MDGIVNIDKPAGRTSFQVVAAVRRLTGERRVGHTGTLDPMATGVLPVCMGKGTRVAQFLAEFDKGYRAVIELGVTTDTYDAEGRVTGRSDATGVNRERLIDALAEFRGEIRQVPPMYSAVKHQGRRLYELAREGETVERRPRPVSIYNLELTDWQPPLATLEVTCSQGTYIRSLAHDLGSSLGCGAYLKSLVRRWCGPFRIEEAVSLDFFEESVKNGGWRDLVSPVDTVLTGWAAVTVESETEVMIANGRAVALDEAVIPGQARAENRCRAYRADGVFLGLLRRESDTGEWAPYKIFV